MTVVPLTDTYESDYLEFLYAAPPESGVITSTGLITWANVGPINPGESKNVRVTFLVKDLSSATEIANTACVSGATFSNNLLTGNACATATGHVTPTGSIAGTVWSEGEGGTNGWAYPITGYEPDIDWGIFGVSVSLFACLDADGDPISTEIGSPGGKYCSYYGGTWTLVDSQVTDDDGYYLFNGLLDGYYYVRVDDATLPGSTYTQTAEAENAGNGSGRDCPDAEKPCDHQWGGDEVLHDGKNTYNINPINDAEDITEINFGYDMPAAIYGTIWHDHNGNGIRDEGDNGLDNPVAGITITLTASDGTTVFTTTTDANGYYEFTGLAADTYTITVLTGTLPDVPTTTWTLTDDPDPNSTCVSSPYGDCDNTYTVAVTKGEISGSHDFGYHASGDTAVGDMVYYDWDGDGQYDAGYDQGIPNISVYLYEDSDGNGRVDPSVDALISTTVTADGTGIYPSGYYTFTGLAPSVYLVVVDTTDPQFPSHVLQTQDPDRDGELCTEVTGCDNRGSADTSGGISLDDVDFGYQPYGFGAIGDTVWRDMNGDGVQSGPQESGIISITVELWVKFSGNDAYILIDTQETDANGKYLFEDLPDAEYQVKVRTDDSDLPTGAFGQPYVPSTPTTVATAITNGNTYLDADFGFMPMGAIGDTIYWDANSNGQEDWNEMGIGAGIVVTLTNTSVITTADGVVHQPGNYNLSTTTDAGGTYLFTGLVPGTYSVAVADLNGYTSPANLTGDPDTNGISCADPDNPLLATCDGETEVHINPGTVFLGADFGYQPSGVIGDFVWYDLDKDGIQDPGEPGISGVTVTVTNGSSTFVTITDYDGYYSFYDLADDTWTVTFEQPADMIPTTISSVAISNGNGSVGTSTTVIIDGGVVTDIGGTTCTGCSLDLNIDSGFVLGGDHKLSGTIFFDYYGTGDGDSDLYDPDLDTPYSNITVYLWDENGQLLGITTTNASGAYTFTHLINGDYTVSVDATSPKINGMDVTASQNPGKTYHTVEILDADEEDIDFGFFAEADFGDLPSSYKLTLVSDAGPYHITGTLRLGTGVSDEADGKEDAFADGDDDDGLADVPDDAWTPGATVDLAVTVTGDGGYLIAWFDWNGNGSFDDPQERVIFGSVAAGINPLSVVVPYAYGGGALNARFRLYDGLPAVISPGGAATNGEVEDYQWNPAPLAAVAPVLTAEGQGHVIVITWETAVEIDVLGFNLYRAQSPDGPLVQINPELIASQLGGSPIGAVYDFVDGAVETGVTYYYWLEVVSFSGSATTYGPVSAVVPAAGRELDVFYSVYLPIMGK
jgi:hypothetical protein